jgi:hypothetical protein
MALTSLSSGRLKAKSWRSHFQAATAQLHAPTSDESAPEIRNVLKIGWTVARGILELAIMVYVLERSSTPGTPSSLLFLALSMRRSAARPCSNIFTITRMAWPSDRQSLEQKRLGEDPNVDSEIANTDASMSRILINSYIAGAFIALQYLVCLICIFSKL